MNLPVQIERVARLDPRALEVWEKAHDFRSRHIDPVADELDKRLLTDPHFFPEDLVRKGCEYGFLSLPIPEFLGGRGAFTLHSALLMETLCSGCAGIANIFGAHYLGLSVVLMSLDVNHYDRFLYEVAAEEKRGVPVLFSAAVTEPMAGTDVEDAEFLPKAKLVTVAKKVEGGYVLNGRKVFISNGSVAKYNVVSCGTERERPLETWSGFLVPAASKGFSVGRVELKMGQRACHAAELVFDDCFVPDENRIGIEGKGMEMTDVILAASRAPVAAIATGIARGAFERTLAFARRRRGGRSPLCEKQWVQLALADMAAQVELARSLYIEAAIRFDSTVAAALLGRPEILNPVMKLLGPLRRSTMGLAFTARESFKRAMASYILGKLGGLKDSSLGFSSLAKFSCSDLAVQVCLKGLQVLGNEGAEERNCVEKSLRDAKLTQIYEGTNQLNRYAVYKTLLRET